MRPLSRALVIAAFVVSAGAVQAQTVNWKYLEGGWLTVNPDSGSSEDGWLIGATGALGKAPIHLFGEFDDLGPIDVWQVGAGWHGLLGERADLFADGAFYDADVDDGFRVRFGVRWMVLKALELNGYLSWTELDFSDNQALTINGIFDFSKRFGVGGGIELGDNYDGGRIFLRFNFGERS